MAKCKTCKKPFKPFNSLEVVCSIKCALIYNKQKKAKEYKQETIKLKKDFYNSDLKTRAKAAKLACHAYIRARDYGRPCICCNRSTSTGKINAGHWLESGNYPSIRFHEDNIHSQLEYCNTYQHGDSDDYEGNLRKKIGDERVDYLLLQKGVSIKRTCDDYREIEKHYKQKLKGLQNDV